ncbi:MAG TPA: GYF domain-containing protein, partial [Polyangiales bacterium]
MHLVCRTCSAVQSVVPERESTCAHCGTSLLQAEAAQSPVHHPESSWYIVGSEGRQGPFDAAELAQKLDRGEFGWSDSVWREGLRTARPARKDDALVVAVARVRGAHQVTTRIDSMLLGASGQTAELESMPDEDTLVDAIPAGLASTWPVRLGWPRAVRPSR